MYVVECKNMAPDRMPHEVKSDLETLFEGKGDRPSAQDKHLKRYDWVLTNLKQVLDSWGLAGGDWRVLPLFVLSQPLHAPLLGHAKMKVLSMADLQAGAPLV
jgi:hypothetical protein